MLAYVRAAAYASDRFDLRMFWKLVSIYVLDNATFPLHAQEMLPPTDPNLLLLIEAHRRFRKVEEACTWWCQQSNPPRGRRTFFEQKKKHERTLSEVLR